MSDPIERPGDHLMTHSQQVDEEIAEEVVNMITNRVIFREETIEEATVYLQENETGGDPRTIEIIGNVGRMMAEARDNDARLA
jgi:hypothetical protein